MDFMQFGCKSPDIKNLKDRHFKKCLLKAGLRRIRFHDLRCNSEFRIIPINVVNKPHVGGSRAN